MYIPSNLAEEFIKDFHQGIIYGYNGAITLINKLQEEYII